MKEKNKSWLSEKMKKPPFKNKFENEYDKLDIAEQLLQLRQQAGLTQAEVAMRVGTTASAISRYENADYDKYEINTIKKIVVACGGKLEISITLLAG